MHSFNFLNDQEDFFSLKSNLKLFNNINDLQAKELFANYFKSVIINIRSTKFISFLTTILIDHKGPILIFPVP
jgi:hypothetical protein